MKGRPPHAGLVPLCAALYHAPGYRPPDRPALLPGGPTPRGGGMGGGGGGRWVMGGGIATVGSPASGYAVARCESSGPRRCLGLRCLCEQWLLPDAIPNSILFGMTSCCRQNISSRSSPSLLGKAQRALLPLPKLLIHPDPPSSALPGAPGPPAAGSGRGGRRGLRSPRRGGGHRRRRPAGGGGGCPNPTVAANGGEVRGPFDLDNLIRGGGRKQPHTSS